MARFPKSEAKVAQLAQQIADGLAGAADDFPSPPVPSATLKAQLDDYQMKRAALAAYRAQRRKRGGAVAEVGRRPPR